MNITFPPLKVLFRNILLCAFLHNNVPFLALQEVGALDHVLECLEAYFAKDRMLESEALHELKFMRAVAALDRRLKSLDCGNQLFLILPVLRVAKGARMGFPKFVPFIKLFLDVV